MSSPMHWHRWSLPFALLALGACHSRYLPDVHSGPLTIGRAFAPVPIGSDPARESMAVYLTITNAGPAADTLLSVETPLAAMGMIHGTVAGQGMVAIPHLVIPADSAVRLAPGGSHFMFEQLRRNIPAGELLPLTLVFAHAGRVQVRARVVTYAEVDALRSDAR